MWLFTTPKSYPEMIKKIAWSMFFLVMLSLLILCHWSKSINTFFKTISLGIECDLWSIKLNIAIVIIPFIFAMIENIFKLHDRISDLFSIRYNFDKNVIIKHFIDSLGIKKSLDNLTNGTRKKVMNEIFYRYAGYSNPQIEQHLIFMALNSWCWFWILLDTSLVVLFIGIPILFIYYSIKKLVFFCVSLLIIILLLVYLVKQQCRRYAINEVDAILEDRKRVTSIRKYLQNAL